MVHLLGSRPESGLRFRTPPELARIPGDGFRDLDVPELQPAGAQPRPRLPLWNHARAGGATGDRPGPGRRSPRPRGPRQGGLGRQGPRDRPRAGGGPRTRLALPSPSARPDRPRPGLCRPRAPAAPVAAGETTTPAHSLPALQAAVV